MCLGGGFTGPQKSNVNLCVVEVGSSYDSAENSIQICNLCLFLTYSLLLLTELCEPVNKVGCVGF